ncbi:hypothetical protein [Sphingopyxis sp. JAI128]|uniref:hypothetical protein n=1 Tax=Sphingopyxis sp. JAI128 TaxID=2723066 RepID=UPI00161E9E35|nr:hypothetical protein [Sphingopyxis sp. JAI128]MBB6427724.1 hypothetical protein [Sphingopyxis sp. JAI128]
MKTDIASIYRSARAFALACPLLFLIPALVELAQHVVEWRAGMYDGVAGAKAAEADPLRLQFGFAKTLAILLPGYWFTRYMLFNRDAARARRIEWPAIGLWFILFTPNALQQWWTLFGPSLTGLLGLTGVAAQWTGYALALLGAVAGIYFVAWTVAWTVGNSAIGPIRSIRIVAGSFWRTVLLILAGALPLMIAHYALSFAAIFGPATLDGPLLLLDALVVGLLALTMAGSNAVAARHAAMKKGLDLATGAPR